MSDKQEKLRPNQTKAIEALASGSSNEQAALAGNVTLRTVYVWRTQDIFKQALQDASDSIMSETVTVLTGASVRAVQILIEIAEDTETPPNTRVSASRAILDATLKLREMWQLEQRIQALESRQAVS